jgi:L-arabonate dehydrase
MLPSMQETSLVLHIAPESYVGGPLALLHTGDWIELDVPGRRLELDVRKPSCSAGRKNGGRRRPVITRGYGSLYAERVTQANLGCDFDSRPKTRRW